MAEVLIGIISGIISGTGMGGGTILIFLLVFVCGNRDLQRSGAGS